MSGRSALDAVDRLLAVADREHLHVLVGKRQLDDALNGDAVVGQEQLVRTVTTCSTRGRTLRVDEVDDVLHRRAGQEDALDASVLQLRDVDVGNDPADDDQHVVEPFSSSSSITRGQMCMCAPDRIDRPMTSASSCSAAATICSGVCRRPV